MFPAAERVSVTKCFCLSCERRGLFDNKHFHQFLHRPLRQIVLDTWLLLCIDDDDDVLDVGLCVGDTTFGRTVSSSHLTVGRFLAVMLCFCFTGGWELNWGSLWCFRSQTEVRGTSWLYREQVFMLPTKGDYCCGLMNISVATLGKTYTLSELWIFHLHYQSQVTVHNNMNC